MGVEGPGVPLEPGGDRDGVKWYRGLPRHRTYEMHAAQGGTDVAEKRHWLDYCVSIAL